jgi:hypothetical protein
MSAKDTNGNQSPRDDPVVQQTEWTSATNHASSSRTHELIETGSRRLEFRSKMRSSVFYTVLVLIGVGVPGITLWAHRTGELPETSRVAKLIVLALAIAVIGAIWVYRLSAPILFDKQIGFFWKGHRSPRKVSDRRQLKKCAKLEDIHALQLLQNFNMMKDSPSFTSYELNVVLEDGRRINVTNHGDRAHTVKSAKTLSVFLDRPVWNALGIKEADQYRTKFRIET